MSGRKALIHVYTGEGKGKTTAALGLALRAAGWGRKVCVFQFLKKSACGEKKAGALLRGRITIVTFGQRHPIFFKGPLRKKTAAKLKKSIPRDLAAVKKTIRAGAYDIIILDEIINAINEGFLKKADILPILNLKTRSSELILTGRGAPQWLIKRADYATRMVAVKHPYEKGVAARKGIEY